METISRAALGRCAQLGDLYNARTDSFCGVSLFKKSIPAEAITVTDNHHVNMEFIFSDSISDKFNKLGVSAELKASFLGGLFTVGGHGKYLSDEKKSARSVKSSLFYNSNTKVSLAVFVPKISIHGQLLVPMMITFAIL